MYQRPLIHSGLRLGKSLLVLVAVAGGASLAAADGPVTLKDESKPGELRQAAITFDVGGELLLVSDDKEIKLPMKVKALIKYQECLVAPGTDGIIRAARNYEVTDVKINVDNRPITPLLREDRRLLSVSLGKELSIFSTEGPLTREELDLVSLPADSLVLGGLLPTEPVRPGDTWNPSDATLATLLDLDVVGQSQVKAMLLEVENGRAKIELSGTVNGAVGGVSSEIDMKARCYYGMASHRLEDVELIYKEKRGVSHSSPGVDVTAKLRIQLAPIKTCKALAPEVVDNLSLVPAPENQALEYASSARKFQLVHDRLWYVAREDAMSTILRRVERGELIAQCNVTTLSALQKDRRTTLPKFQEDIKKSLGDNFGDFVTATEDQDKEGRLIYRVSATGEVSELPVEWIYYLVQDAEGRRTSVVFTLQQSLAERFAGADRALVASLSMLSPSGESQAKPTPDTAAAVRTDEAKLPVPPPDKSVTVPTTPRVTSKDSAEKKSR